MSRDPRIDPKPGDVLTLIGSTYTILSVERGVVVDQCNGGSRNGDTLTSPVVDWRLFMRDAEVIHVAE